MPLPSARVLAELLAAAPPLIAEHRAGITPAFIALKDLEAALAAHAAALHARDQMEADLVARHGHPRVRLPTPAGTPPIYATDTNTATAVTFAAETILVIPAADLPTLYLQLALIIAMGEAGPAEAITFPWSQLRRLLSQLGRQL